ncbi:hypothetical protein FQZ97_1076310 [compost metagenome]
MAIEKIDEIVAVKPTDTAIAIIQQAALGQKERRRAKAYYRFAPFVGSFDQINQRLLTRAILCKQTANHSHIVTFIKFADGSGRLNDHAGTGRDRIA